MYRIRVFWLVSLAILHALVTVLVLTTPAPQSAQTQGCRSWRSCPGATRTTVTLATSLLLWKCSEIRNSKLKKIAAIMITSFICRFPQIAGVPPQPMVPMELIIQQIYKQKHNKTADPSQTNPLLILFPVHSLPRHFLFWLNPNGFGTIRPEMFGIFQIKTPGGENG